MNKKYIEIDNESQFALSTGDLMAALLMIFVLLLVGTMLKLQDEFESKSKVAEKYKELQIDLYTDLNSEFEKDLAKWGAEIDSTLTLRFKEPDVLFAPGKSVMKRRFTEIIDDFFPRYIKVLQSDKYINHIEEIRIEGHTSSIGKVGMDEEESYFFNMKLSQDRTRTVLKECLNSIKISDSTYQWTKFRTSANGLSSVKPIGDNNTINGRELNRRVEFRIKTDAEAQIREMLKYAND